MNVELCLISKILQDKSLVKVIDKQITPKYFTGRNKHYFKFIQEHQKKYGKTPSAKVFAMKFPDVALEDVEESVEFYCDEVRTKYKHNTIVSELEVAMEDINSLETDNAYDKLKKIVLKVENEIILSDSMAINKDTQSRMEDYLKRAKTGGITGIPTGIDRLDTMIKGCNKAELITVIGFTGTGKTFLEVIMGCNMAKDGNRVLFITTEMSTKAIMRRVDAVWNRFSYTRFRDGQLTDVEFKKFEKYLQKVDGSDYGLIIEQATAGISQISAKIEQYSPDIVIIDGGYMLEDDESEDDDWRALVRIWRGLHRLCLVKDIPIIVSTQSTDPKVSLRTVSFAKAIMAYTDIAIGVEVDDQMKRDKELALVPLKIREAELLGKIVMNFDMNKPDWSTIYVKDSKDFEKLEEDDVPKAIQKIKKPK